MRIKEREAVLKEKFDLSGKIALVTGSSRGIGKAIGDAFEEYGAKVIRHDTKVCDFVDPDAIEKWFDTLEKEGNLPDILVANVSIQERFPWSEFPLNEARKEMQVNFFATLRMFQRCYPKMKAQKWGRLIVVGSVQEKRPHPMMVAYAATKGALENMVRNVARQVASEGITVNNLCPGVFATDRNKDALSNPEYAQKVFDAIPMHFAADTVDAVGAALLLASDAGRYITGSTIMVDGGLSLPG